MTVTYHVGDTRAVTATLPDGSIDLIASSPPFLALRSYLPAGHEAKGDEIGSETNPAEFIDTLLALTAEWGRVLAPHGSIAIELGDSYSRSGGAGGDYNAGGLHDGQEKFRTKSWEGWPGAKSLALIPQIYAVALAYGINPLTGAPSPAGRWLVRNVIVWHRPNPAVGELGDKVRPSTSYIVIATRDPKRWFDLTAVRGAPVVPTLSRVGAASASLGISGGDSGNPDKERLSANPAGAPPLDCWFDQYDGSHDTWTLTTQPSRLAHYAMWPAKLAQRLVLSMCPAQVCVVCGDPRRRVEVRTAPFGHGHRRIGAPDAGNRVATTFVPDFTSLETLGWTDCNGRHAPSSPPYYRSGVVLDPFAGTGTTLAVADLHGRDAIGIDIDERNHDIYPHRYNEVKRALFGTIPEMPGQGDLFATEIPA